MDDAQRSDCLKEMRAHEDEANRLAQTLAQLDRDAAGAPRRPDAVFVTVQIMRHRISAALLAAKIEKAS